MEHLFDKLAAYREADIYPCHMPGHKREALGKLPSALAGIDITEIEGFDNLHQPEGLLRELQQRAAVLCGAEESFYLVNGSTGGVLSAVSAALPRGGRILMARNCHKSAYHAAYLRGLKISYLYPELLEEYDIYEAVTGDQIRLALEREPDIGAVLIVSPTYEGRIADVAGIARVVHDRGIPLIVDEAHGAHLGLNRRVHENSCQAGADLVIQSVHKTLPALTQTALLHVNGKRIDRELLRRFLRIYQSSSPSYLLMASIDSALDYVESCGEEVYAAFERQYQGMLKNLRKCRHLRFLPEDPERQDLGKLVISVKNTTITGKRLYDILLDKYQIQTEMAAESYVLAMFTLGDGSEGYARMERALLEIDGKLGKDSGENRESGGVFCIRSERFRERGEEPSSAVQAEASESGKRKQASEALAEVPGNEKKKQASEALAEVPGNGKKKQASEALAEAPWNGKEKQLSEALAEMSHGGRKETDSVIPLETAWDGERELTLLSECAGRYAGEFINLYPPGIPLAVPGERLTEEMVRDVFRWLEEGLNIQGLERRGGEDFVWTLRKESGRRHPET
ncbi:MAG: PLP-dependent transferase [bacterium]|nr:PLP-dependent transferase [bacterium]